MANQQKSVSVKLNVLQTGLKNISALIQELKRAGVETNSFEKEAAELSGAMRQLAKEQGMVDAFKRLKSETESTEKAMESAKQRAAELGRELKNTEAPTKAQATAFEKARKTARDTEQAYQDNRLALQNMRGQMQQAGISTKDLAGHQGVLRREQQATTAKSKELTDSLKQAGAAAGKRMPDPTPDLQAGLKKTNDIAGDLKAELARLVTAAALGKFVSDSVQAVRAAEASFRGLEAVAEHTGVGIGRAFQEAQKLAADGLMSVSDASKSLQNLLSRGYSLDEAIDTITRLKDAAAFNRAAHLSMSEAVLTATEGLKNENSTLIDNAGVTKNVAKMWEEYAKQLGKSTASLTDAEKRQAEINGIMQETEAQVGNAQKALSGFEGQIAQNQKSINELETALGVALIPALTNLTQAGTLVTNDFVKPFLGGIEIMAIKVAAVAQSVDDFWTVLTSVGDEAEQASARINRNFELADEMAAQVVGRYEGGLIPAAQEAAAATQAHGDASQAAGEQAAAATDKAAVAASDLVAQLNAAGSAGTGAGQDITSALSGIDITSADGVRTLALAFEQAGDKASQMETATAKAIAEMSSADLTTFSDQIYTAFVAGTSGAEQLTQINDLVLTESFKRLGLTAEAELGRISPKAQEAIGALDAIRKTLDKTGSDGEQKMLALGNAITQALGRADTMAAAEEVKQRIEAMGMSGELAGKQLERAMSAAQGRIEELTPGINSVEEAMKKLGITSQESLRQSAAEARTAFETIRDGGTTIEEQRRAWVAWAEEAMRSGDAAQIAIAEVEAGIYGASDSLGRLAGQQAVVGDATRDSAAALREQAQNAAAARVSLDELAGSAAGAASSQRDLAAATQEASDASGSVRGAQAINYDALSEKELERELQRLKGQIAQSYGSGMDARYGAGSSVYFREQWQKEIDRVNAAMDRLQDRSSESSARTTQQQTQKSIGTVNVNFRSPAGGIRTVRVVGGDEKELLEALRDSQLIS